jgi:aminomethyltransferase
MKKTVFHNKHKELGARLIEFAGYEMPLEYSGIIDEHLAVRHAAGIFDVSHMGEIWLKGKGAKLLLDRVLSNNPAMLLPGKAQYSCLLNGEGGIVDDIIVHQYEEEKYLMVVNASNIEKDWNWLQKNNSFGAVLENASDRMSQIAIQGPLATKILQRLTPIDMSSVRHFTFVTGEVAGLNHIMIAATGYTGSGGFELYFENSNDPLLLWDQLFDAGKPEGLIPVGLAARDTLRLEMGYCLYGNDISDDSSPFEAGLGWTVKFNEGRDFLSRDLLLKHKNEGVSKRLVGFEMIDRGIPRQHYPLYSLSGEIIGEVTSGTMSPCLKTGIGLGYVKINQSVTGEEIYVDIRGRKLRARIVNLPFFKPGQTVC